MNSQAGAPRANRSDSRVEYRTGFTGDFRRHDQTRR